MSLMIPSLHTNASCVELRWEIYSLLPDLYVFWAGLDHVVFLWNDMSIEQMYESDSEYIMVQGVPKPKMRLGGDIHVGRLHSTQQPFKHASIELPRGGRRCSIQVMAWYNNLNPLLRYQLELDRFHPRTVPNRLQDSRANNVLDGLGNVDEKVAVPALVARAVAAAETDILGCPCPSGLKRAVAVAPWRRVVGYEDLEASCGAEIRDYECGVLPFPRLALLLNLVGAQRRDDFLVCRCVVGHEDDWYEMVWKG
jgi:hypothetical protein